MSVQTLEPVLAGLEARVCEGHWCDRAPVAKGLCLKHYKRLRRGRALDDNERVKGEPIDRLLSKVRIEGSCWIWTGARNRGGYGVVGVGRRSEGTKLAHRLSYEIHVGLIPDGLHLDHLCVTPACVNPEHLEPVTQQENNRRERARLEERKIA